MPALGRRGDWPDGRKQEDRASSRQLQGVLQRTLLEACPLAEPGTVEPEFLAAGTLFMVHELGDRVEQSPGRAAGRCQLCAVPLPLVERLDLLERPLVRQDRCLIGLAVGLAQHFEEVVHGLVVLHLALRQGLHAVHEAVPLRDGNAQLLLDRLRVKARAVRHLDGTGSAVQGNRQGVVAHHADGRGRRRGGQAAVAGRGQQQVAVDDVVSLERHGLAGARQRPELAAFLEGTGGLQLEAGDFGQVAVELQHGLGLHHLVAAAHDRQRRLGVAAVQHLVVVERHDGT